MEFRKYFLLIVMFLLFVALASSYKTSLWNNSQMESNSLVYNSLMATQTNNTKIINQPVSRDSFMYPIFKEDNNLYNN